MQQIDFKFNFNKYVYNLKKKNCLKIYWQLKFEKKKIFLFHNYFAVVGKVVIVKLVIIVITSKYGIIKNDSK